jgi:hypothetical protein
MMRSLPTLVLAFGGLVGLSAIATDKPTAGLVAVEAPPPRPIEPKARPRPLVLITAELSQSRAHPGDVVRLTELVPSDREIRVSSYRHTVHIVGQYDLAANALVNRDPEKPLYSAGDLVFDAWSGSATALGDKYFRFEVTNPRQEGKEFEFKARQLGIYLIKAEWTVYRTGEVMESNPVILTVSPSLDKDGKPIIKEAWVDPIEWKHRPR